MRVLLDTNVVLDVLLERGEWLEAADAIWTACDEGRIEACLSASCLTDVYYIARRMVGRDRASDFVAKCLGRLTILSVDRAALEKAHALGGDFEDALQIVISDREGVVALVTRDADGFTRSTVPVLTPQELREWLPATD